MSETGGAAEAARLDELAAVTAEYAKYSRTAAGLGFVATGAAFLGVVALDVVADSRSSRVAFTLLPVLWLLVLAGARRWYQRRGLVVEPGQRIGGRGWQLAFLWLLCAALALRLAAELESVRGHAPLVLGNTFAVLGVVAVPLLASEVARGRSDILVTWELVAVALFAGQLHPSDSDRVAQLNAIMRTMLLVFLAVSAVLAIYVGLQQHRHYRSLERRLAALRSPAA